MGFQTQGAGSRASLRHTFAWDPGSRTPPRPSFVFLTCEMVLDHASHSPRELVTVLIAVMGCRHPRVPPV